MRRLAVLWLALLVVPTLAAGPLSLPTAPTYAPAALVLLALAGADVTEAPVRLLFRSEH